MDELTAEGKAAKWDRMTGEDRPTRDYNYWPGEMTVKRAYDLIRGGVSAEELRDLLDALWNEADMNGADRGRFDALL